MGISEEELPGIGRRYEIDVLDQDRLVAVVHNNGRRDLFAFRPGASSARASLTLDERTAAQVGAILSGAYARPATGEAYSNLLERFALEAMPVPDDSSVAGTTIADAAIRRRTGASVVAVLAAKETHLDPMPSTVLQAGDLLLVVGDSSSISRVEALLADELLDLAGPPGEGGDAPCP